MADVDKALREAVMEGDITLVQELLKQHADPNYQDTTSPTVGTKSTLHIAVSHGKIDIVCLLLQNGGDPNLEDEMKCTPIFPMPMSDENATQLTRILLQHGADVSHVNKVGTTALLSLIAHKILPYEELVLLIEGITDINQRPLCGGNLLHLLIYIHPDEEDEELDEDQHFCEDYFHRLYDKGISLNARDDDGDTPLHVAASNVCLRSIKAMVEKGADVNARNYSEETPLFFIAESTRCKRFSEALDYLLSMGADINALDDGGRSPLHDAVANENVDPLAIQSLIRCGANVNITDCAGGNLIHSFVRRQDNKEIHKDEIVTCLRILIEAGLDINGMDIFSETPLLMAAIGKDLPLFEALLESGANVTQRSKTGENSIHRASFRYMLWPTCLDWCLRHGIDLNTQDKFGSTALHWAIWFREQTTIKSLLENGADTKVKDLSGRTAMDLARALKYDQYRLLVEKPEVTSNIVMKLGNLDVEYHGTDIFEECPTMEYIDKTNNTVELEEWFEHLKVHGNSVKAFLLTVLESPVMGLYFDLDENDIIPKLMDQIMTALANHVSEAVPLMSCNTRLAGSRFEGTKIHVPDEFDYLFSLAHFSNSFIPVEDGDSISMHVKLQLKDGIDRKPFINFIDADGYLDGSKVNRAFYATVNECLLKIFKERVDLDLGNISIVGMLDSASGNLASLTFKWIGPVMKYHVISVDVVPEILPDDWVPRSFQRHDAVMKRLGKKVATSVVLKTADFNFVPEPSKWFRISFASWEQAIIRSFPIAIKKGYIIVKALLSSYYFPTIIDNDNDQESITLLTSYKLKTCFLHELDKATLANDETLGIGEEDTAAAVSLDWARRIVNHLEMSIEEGCLPSFFDPSRNLLLYQGSEVLYQIPEYKAFVSCLKRLLEIGSAFD